MRRGRPGPPSLAAHLVGLGRGAQVSAVILRCSALAWALALTACNGARPLPDSGAAEDSGGELTCCDAAAIAPGCQRSGGGAIRVLFVGNSQIDFWDLPLVVSSLSRSAPVDCPRIEGERFTIGGANLRDLWTAPDTLGRRLPELIASGNYDVVVLAESIDLVELRPPYPEQFVSVATEIAAAAREAGVLPLLYATPYVERPDRSGFREMADPQIALAEELGVPIAAGGLAWLRVWEERPEADLYFEDRQHPGLHGSYVSALVIWSAITGGSPIGLSASPEARCEAECPTISAEQAALYQRAALAQHLETGR